MNYWKTFAMSAFLLTAIAGGAEVIVVEDEGTAAFDECTVASGWERIETPSDPNNPDTTIVRTNASRWASQPAAELAHAADRIF